jgi:hypothetical protein
MACDSLKLSNNPIEIQKMSFLNIFPTNTQNPSEQSYSPFKVPFSTCYLTKSQDDQIKLSNHNFIYTTDETQNALKLVKNAEGKEFVYYENLEEVRNALSKKFPSMSKHQMYRELLKPYKHAISQEVDSKTGAIKEVYMCGYDS